MFDEVRAHVRRPRHPGAERLGRHGVGHGRGLRAAAQPRRAGVGARDRAAAPRRGLARRVRHEPPGALHPHHRRPCPSTSRSRCPSAPAKMRCASASRRSPSTASEFVVVSGDMIEGTITATLLERANPGAIAERRESAGKLYNVERVRRRGRPRRSRSGPRRQHAPRRRHRLVRGGVTRARRGHREARLGRTPSDRPGRVVRGLRGIAP